MIVALSVFVILHGLVHVLGFLKAFKPSSVTALKEPISRGAGMLWVLCAVLMCTAGVCLLLGVAAWWMLAVAGVVLSQVLIVSSWADAKFGTIPNVVILIATVVDVISELPIRGM